MLLNNLKPMGIHKYLEEARINMFNFMIVSSPTYGHTDETSKEFKWT